jgi:hypothetical protein
MNPKKPIPVKYFYYGMLACALFVGGIIIYFHQKEVKEEQLLDEKGITTEALITNLYSKKIKKRAKPSYYMDVAFFTDGKPIVEKEEATMNEPKTGDEIIAAMAKQTQSLKQPLGDNETQTIPIVSYEIYKQYQINDKVKVVFLKDDPSVIRLK